MTMLYFGALVVAGLFTLAPGRLFHTLIFWLKWHMVFLVFKFAVTAGLIVLVSEVAKLSPKYGGLIAAMPVTTILVLLWMHIEGNEPQKIATHVSYTLLYVLPTLPMFLVFPMLIHKWGFAVTLAFVWLMTAGLVLLTDMAARQFGLRLL